MFFSLSVWFHYIQQFLFTEMGQMGHPVKSTMLLLENQFFYAGKIMTMSITQGGPKPTILSKDVYKFITSERLLSPKEFNFNESFLEREEVKKVSYKIQITKTLVFKV